MRLGSQLLAGIFLVAALAPTVGAGVANHEDRHEHCEIYGGPGSHSVGDGHVHAHTAAEAAARGFDDQDPCNQSRMSAAMYEPIAPASAPEPPLVELDPIQLLFADGDPTDAEVFTGGEAYELPLPQGALRRQVNLVVTSDVAADAMGFPGTGTATDPYIVEGFLITGSMLFKDTNRCFVLRNNVVMNRLVQTPLLPDPQNLAELADQVPYWQGVKDAALARRADYIERASAWDEAKADWDAQKAQWDQLKDVWDQERAAFEAEAAQWEADFDRFEQAYLDEVFQREFQADDYEFYAAESLGYLNVPQPERVYSQFIDRPNRTVLDMERLQPAFEGYQEDLDGVWSNDNIEGWIRGNPPPEDPPPGFWGNQEDWDWERQNWQAYTDYLIASIHESYWDVLMPTEPSRADYEQFLAEYAAFQAGYDAFIADYEAFLSEYDAFLSTYNAFRQEFDQAWQETGDDIADADAFIALASIYPYEYDGVMGHRLFRSLEEILDYVLEIRFGPIDVRDPNVVAGNTGQLILDWTGPCIHAYNNVVNDLRVNQNNDRTGWATGGIIEDNRLFTIGQIRHYDGIFRQNEVGNRAHLHAILNPSVTPVPGSARSLNIDGANQGWYLENTIYGNVDLDFHGHSHSAGFFAPTAHYHGSAADVAYMRADGACTATDADVDMDKANGPYRDYPADNDVDVLGTTVADLADSNPNCLPRMDHGKRWTSVLFNDNLVIDPNGAGLRFEDRDHRADDEQSNSENMRELKRPHFHQKWVQLEDNTIVGRIFIDVLNAPGTDLWSDNWAAVANPGGVARTIESAGHPGADVVNSHPYRNDAWLDIQRNTIFLTQSKGVLVSDAEDMTRFQLKQNRGFGLPSAIQTGMTPPSFLAWLRSSQGRSVASLQAEIQSWGGVDRGVQTFAEFGDLRDAFLVEHCGNVARGVDRGLIATDRIFDDGLSIILACGTNDWGAANPGVDIVYTPVPPPATRCTDDLRQQTRDTDDFYATELVFDTLDPLADPESCQGPAAAPTLVEP